MASDVKEYGLKLAAKMNIEAPVPRARWIGLRHQCPPPFLRNQPENRILLVSGIAGKIYARVQMIQQTSGKNRQVQVRHLWNACPAGYTPRLDRLEPAASIRSRAARF